jgi:hypothetical protein
LDKEIESGELWKEVGDLIKQGTSMSGGLTGERLETILKSSIGFKGMSEIQQMDWLNETNNLIASALKWLASDKAVKTEGAEIKFKIVSEDGKESKELIGTVNKRGQVETEDGIFNKVVMNANGEYKTFESLEEASKNKSQADRDSTKPEEIAMFPYGKPSQLSKQPEGGEHSGLIKALQHALNVASDGKSALAVDGIWGLKTSGATYSYTSGDSWSKRMTNLEAEVEKKFKKLQNDGKINLSQFKTGGLADFTGPAWLDGTKSRPEYILNADQTKAFFNLVDVLGSLQTSSFKTAQNSGDNTYDIDINVESIGSDYDVEQLATTVKRLINEDARYRNNNTINLTR